MTSVQAALARWGFDGGRATLIAARENKVYRIDHAGQSFALRLHRRGYRQDAELSAELDWMAWLAQNGLSVPHPIASARGAHLEHVQGVQVDVLSWVAGTTLDQILPDADGPTRAALFRELGVQMARLHAMSDAWPGAATCARAHWDGEGLLGADPLWGRFWENPDLSQDQRAMLIAFREAARAQLNSRSPELDYGLIHADLVSQNVMVEGERIHLIDFDDGGFGFRIFEVATALYPHRFAADFETLKSGLIAGYRSERALDVAALELFMALRAVTYVGWNIPRMSEDPSAGRNARYIAAALAQAEAWGATQG